MRAATARSRGGVLRGFTARALRGVFFGATVACAARASLGAEFDRPTLEVGGLTGDIRVDGVLDEPDWELAPLASDLAMVEARLRGGGRPGGPALGAAPPRARPGEGRAAPGRRSDGSHAAQGPRGTEGAR